MKPKLQAAAIAVGAVLACWLVAGALALGATWIGFGVVQPRGDPCQQAAGKLYYADGAITQAQYQRMADAC